MQEKQSKTLSEFISEAKEIHGDKYTYEDVIYTNTSTKVVVKCKIHGNFKITPDDNFVHYIILPIVYHSTLKDQCRNFFLLRH